MKLLCPLFPASWSRSVAFPVFPRLGISLGWVFFSCPHPPLCVSGWNLGFGPAAPMLEAGKRECGRGTTRSETLGINFERMELEWGERNSWLRLFP